MNPATDALTPSGTAAKLCTSCGLQRSLDRDQRKRQELRNPHPAGLDFPKPVHREAEQIRQQSLATTALTERSLLVTPAAKGGAIGDRRGDGAAG